MDYGWNAVIYDNWWWSRDPFSPQDARILDSTTVGRWVLETVRARPYEDHGYLYWRGGYAHPCLLYVFCMYQ